MESEKNKLFVGNLSFSIDQERLSSIFSEVEGIEVVEAALILDRETKRPRGFGFVTVKTEEMAQKAVDALNGKEIEGREIVVNIAKPREDRPAGGQGGYNRDRRY
ncbi:MAG: RNA-binding protein [Candidatus Berkelbacteria bacterium]|nr:RNA-binding protein [Candidatus Berkelbacteria bacterium]